MKIAAVFPGQGSQSVGMLADLYEQFAEVRETFEQAADILSYDLWQLLCDGPEEQLKQTQYTQPAMFVSDIAVWRAWNAAGGPAVSMMAGHSLGEFAALTASGVFSYSEAVSLVQTRAQLMADAVPAGEGGMAAVIGMDDQALVDLCASMTGERVVEAVNFNSPGQVVVSGHVDALEKLVAVAKDHGARKAMLLPVSVPNHSSLMRVVGDPLAAKIETMTLGEASVPVVQNLPAKALESNADIISVLKQHVFSPVYWTGSVQQMQQMGAEIVVEMGPGKVLAGLVKRIDRKLPSVPVLDVETLNQAIAKCQ